MSFFFVFLVSWLNSKGLFADLKFELFNIINPTLSILVSLLLYLLCLWIMFWKWLRHCIHRWALAFFLKTRQVQMWIFVNMIMEINVWLLYKKPNKSVQLPFRVSWKSHVYRGSFITNTKLERVQLSFFHIDWLQLQKSIAKFNFQSTV